MRILTIDLGTSATKAALWSEDGPIAVGRATVDVEHPRPGWVEQDPETWWSSTLDACAQLPEDERAQVDAVGFSSQRDTFVPVTTAGEPVGRAIASADRRAGEMVAGLGRDFQVLTGVVPDAGTVAAKVAWIRRHEPDRLSGGQRWIMGPRDLVAFRLTGRGVTDTSVASRTGLLALDGAGLDGAELLPEVVGPTTIIGNILPAMASSLGVPRRHAGRGRRRRSRVRAARRRGDDRPTDGVVGVDRRGVRPGRARPAARSGDRRLARRARRDT